MTIEQIYAAITTPEVMAMASVIGLSLLVSAYVFPSKRDL